MAIMSRTILERDVGSTGEAEPIAVQHIPMPRGSTPVDAHRDSVARTLCRSPLFSELDDRTRRQIAAYVHVRRFAPGQIIAWEGEPTRAVCLVASGEVRVYRLSLEGREYVLNHMGPGQALNLVPALDGGVNIASVESVTDTTVYVIPRERFRHIVRDHPQFATAILQHLAGQVRQLSDIAENLALHSVRTRLARFLLSSTTDDTRPSRHWTQGEIAAHIGTVRDVVGRTLRSFSGEGLVRRERRRLVVTNLAGVRREAMR